MFFLVEKPRQTTIIPAVTNKLSHFQEGICALLKTIEISNGFKTGLKETAGINA
ncbi:MAG: hypothetical protein JSW11_15510 [Candidatus Heimdallarchaeota archaeon]|nr:MAG: hypothetical protein JSW11_15510 [Candidatus Heimdallarchaeota archaeon]